MGWDVGGNRALGSDRLVQGLGTARPVPCVTLEEVAKLL